MIGAALLTLAKGARADEALRSDAKALAVRGDAEFYAGRCAEAIPLWRAAEAKFHAPTIQIRIARCQALLGQVVAAASLYESIAAERLAADAPAAFVAARAEAKRELPAVRGRIATLRVLVKLAVDREPPEIEIDGARMPAGATSFPVDPGDRALKVRARRASFEIRVALREGEPRVVHVALGLEPEARSERVRRAAGLAALGAGSAGVIAGLGLSLAAAVNDRPIAARGLSSAAQATLAASAIVAIGGAITLITTPARGDAWRVRVSAASISVEGTF